MDVDVKAGLYRLCCRQYKTIKNFTVVLIWVYNANFSLINLGNL